MSCAQVYGAGSIGSAHVEFSWSRWGGGAHAGRTHVFSDQSHTSPFAAYSIQCVVDDYGTLVPAVQS